MNLSKDLIYIADDDRNNRYAVAGPLDMNMPNGLETLMAIRENPLLRHTPTVMISTSAEPTEVANAYRLGINVYIRKSATHAYVNQIAQAIRVCFLDTTVG